MRVPKVLACAWPPCARFKVPVVAPMTVKVGGVVRRDVWMCGKCGNEMLTVEWQEYVEEGS